MKRLCLRSSARELEDAAAEMANTINISACRSLGVHESFIEEWAKGVELTGVEGREPFVFDDYPNLQDNAKEAALKLDRLTLRHKVCWYPKGTSPDNLNVCPGNLSLTGCRPRVVQDWTKAGLNQRLVIPKFIMAQWIPSSRSLGLELTRQDLTFKIASYIGRYTRG